MDVSLEGYDFIWESSIGLWNRNSSSELQSSIIYPYINIVVWTMSLLLNEKYL